MRIFNFHIIIQALKVSNLEHVGTIVIPHIHPHTHTHRDTQGQGADTHNTNTHTTQTQGADKAIQHFITKWLE